MSPELPKIDLAHPEGQPKEQRPSPTWRWFRRALYLCALFFIVTFSFGYHILFAEYPIFSFSSFPIFRTLRSLAQSNSLPLNGEAENRINVLLLGMGGVGHEGPHLTDTIILASIEPSTRRIALLSLPRDLSIPIQQYGWRKINAANAFGEMERPGEGGSFVADILSTLLQIPIHYYVRVDFRGLTRVVDDLGGITLTVDRAFTDMQYPTEDFKHQTIHFDQGPQHMGGERILEFVRSRHGNNTEGSDFARAARQQKVLFGIRERLLSLNTLIRPSVLSGLIETYKEDVQTNISLGEMVRLARLLKYDDATIAQNIVLHTGVGGLLRPFTYDGAFLLEPRTGNFDEIRSLVQHLFNPLPISDVVSQIISLDIRNGTGVPGLASRTASLLQTYGYRIIAIGNAPDTKYEQSVLIDMTEKEKIQHASAIGDALDISLDVLMPPPGLRPAPHAGEFQTTADFLLILGHDYVAHKEKDENAVIISN